LLSFLHQFILSRIRLDIHIDIVYGPTVSEMF